jgi:hypothetical protein
VHKCDHSKVLFAKRVYSFLTSSQVLDGTADKLLLLAESFCNGLSSSKSAGGGAEDCLVKLGDTVCFHDYLYILNPNSKAEAESFRSGLRYAACLKGCTYNGQLKLKLDEQFPSGRPGIA